MPAHQLEKFMHESYTHECTHVFKAACWRLTKALHTCMHACLHTYMSTQTNSHAGASARGDSCTNHTHTRTHTSSKAAILAAHQITHAHIYTYLRTYITAQAAMVALQLEETSAVQCVAISIDSSMIASSHGDSIKLRCRDTGQLLFKLPSNEYGTRCLDFSRDGKAACQRRIL
jgi:hypothetical protein